MININPAEISEILKQQLKNFRSDTELEEVGTVLQVGDGIARIYGLSNVESNEMIEFESGIKGIVLNLEQDNIGAVLLGPSDQVKEGDTVKRMRRIASIMAGESLLGRVINTIGEPLLPLLFEQLIANSFCCIKSYFGNEANEPLKTIGSPLSTSNSE